MKAHFLAAAAAIASLGATSAAQAAVIDFDTLTSGASVNEAYNGGTDSLGESGPNFGIEFVDFTVQASDSSVGVFGNSSPPEFVFNTTDVSYINVFDGFTTFGFDYGNLQPVTAEVYSGLDGAGTLLDSFVFPAYLKNDGTGQPWSLGGGFQLSGTGHSLVLVGMAEQNGFDDVFFGGTPEPVSWALMIIGFGGVGAALRRQHMAGAFV